MDEHRYKEPFFNFTEPVPAFLAGGLILSFMTFSYLPGVFPLVSDLVILRPLGFQGTSQAEQVFSLLGHGFMNSDWTNVLINSGLVAVLGVVTVKGARLQAISKGLRRSANLAFLTVFVFGVVSGGLASWLWWFVTSAPLGTQAPATLGTLGGVSALLASAGWAMGGRHRMLQFAIGWGMINALLVTLGPLLGTNIGWTVNFGGYLGGMILGPLLVKANSTSFGI